MMTERQFLFYFILLAVAVAQVFLLVLAKCCVPCIGYRQSCKPFDNVVAGSGPAPHR